jgi:hypothetical protein
MTRTFHPRIIPAKIVTGCFECPFSGYDGQRDRQLPECCHPYGPLGLIDILHPGFPVKCPLDETL